MVPAKLVDLIKGEEDRDQQHEDQLQGAITTEGHAQSPPGDRGHERRRNDNGRVRPEDRAPRNVDVVVVPKHILEEKTTEADQDDQNAGASGCCKGFRQRLPGADPTQQPS